MKADDKCTLCGVTRAESYENQMGMCCHNSPTFMHVWPSTAPLTHVQFIATGDYQRPMPEELVNGLAQEISAHLKAYGFRDVIVFGGHVTSAFAKQPELADLRAELAAANEDATQRVGLLISDLKVMQGQRDAANERAERSIAVMMRRLATDIGKGE